MIACPGCGSVYWAAQVLCRVKLEYMEDGTHEVETESEEIITVYCDECGADAREELPNVDMNILFGDVLD